jgi:peptidoglycan/LPS O-acetylase OafA/YrhL
MRVRNHALDGLHGLAALGVLTLHVWMFTVQGAHGRDELVSLLTGELRLGVVLFFVLSGHLLAGPWVAGALEQRPTPRLGRFAVKRAARIVPGYWVAMLGSFCLLAGTGHAYEVSAGQLPLFAAFGQNYVGAVAGRLDPPMWSLVVEVSFYAVLPLAGWLLVRCARRGRMVVACAGLAGLGRAWSAAGALLAGPRRRCPPFRPSCPSSPAAWPPRRWPIAASRRARRGGRAASRASRPSCTSSRCRAWPEPRDDGVRLVDDVLVGEAHDAVSGGREGWGAACCRSTGVCADPAHGLTRH